MEKLWNFFSGDLYEPWRKVAVPKPEWSPIFFLQNLFLCVKVPAKSAIETRFDLDIQI